MAVEVEQERCGLRGGIAGRHVQRVAPVAHTCMHIHAYTCMRANVCASAWHDPCTRVRNINFSFGNCCRYIRANACTSACTPMHARKDANADRDAYVRMYAHRPGRCTRVEILLCIGKAMADVHSQTYARQHGCGRTCAKNMHVHRRAWPMHTHCAHRLASADAHARDYAHRRATADAHA